MFSSHRTAALAAAWVAVLVAMPAAAQTLRSGNAADVTRRTDFRDLGRAPASMPVNIAVTLNYQHEPELAQLTALQGNRRSPVYHRYLSSAQFNTYFAPSPASY